MQWLSCQLYATELPLRHLFIHLDGLTTGPKGFSGSLGKALNKVEERSVVAFKPIESKMPLMTIAELSTYQKYLYEICQAVSTGICPKNLEARANRTCSLAYDSKSHFAIVYYYT
jgi:hypothetical protein